MPYKDPQKNLESKLVWALANPEKVLESARKASAKYYARTGYSKIWQKKNRDRVNANKRAWRSAHPELRKNPYEIIRQQVKEALRGHLKVETTQRLIGCTPDELRRHLELQFKSGMNWGNHGIFGWHVDHIRPVSSFDLSDSEQQRACFHFTNLQPLWWYENLAKSDSWAEPNLSKQEI